MKDKIIVSTDEQERLAALDMAIHEQLMDWMQRFAEGVRYTPAVAKVLARNLIELGTFAAIASSDRENKRPNDQTESRCRDVAARLVSELEREIST